MKRGCTWGALSPIPPVPPLLGVAGGIFLACVLGACPQAAAGPEIPVFTVRFDTGPEGSAVPSQTAGEGEKIEMPDPPANASRYLQFKEWRTGDGTDGEWKKVWNFTKNTVHEDMTLYARWIESAARNEGIWRNENNTAAYLLNEDGGAWYIDWYGVQHTQWSGAAIGGEEVKFSGEEGARELNAGNSVFKRVSPSEERPAPLGDAAIAGRYIGYDYGAGQYTAALELGFDGFGTLRTASDGELPLAFRAEADALLLLEHGYPHRVLLWLPVSGGYIGEFAREKEGGRESLAGVWEA
ncbi:MAG: InlB B-repeat-containing protein, partial [Treponema sp.]|nr:InlB B-repeat-containing protein [Treponema sp.]